MDGVPVPRPRRRTAMSQIAEQAGVSLATVSRVLNNHPAVSPEMREKVLRQSHELGYTETRRRDSTRHVGVVVPHLDDAYYYARIANNIALALQERGGHLHLCIASYNTRSGRERPSDETTATIKRFLTSGIEGALLVHISASRDELARLQDFGCPFTVIGEHIAASESIASVGVADYAGARSAVDHLLALGHTCIGLVTGPAKIQDVVHRSAGYHAALVAVGLPINADLVQEGDFTAESGYQGAQRLLALPQPPTAIFAQNDRMAYGVMRAAEEHGLSVPGDLSVVGFDDETIPSFINPVLTTVRQPMAELGAVGVDMLYHLLDGELTAIRRVELATNLIIRRSTAPPRTPRI